MSNSIAPGSSADVNVKVTALTTNPNVPAQYKTIILKKNLVNGVNTLTQDMMSATNTKYVIKYDYVLGEDVTVPANCILEFDGGSFSGGILFSNGTVILGNPRIEKYFGAFKDTNGNWLDQDFMPFDFVAKKDGIVTGRDFAPYPNTVPFNSHQSIAEDDNYIYLAQLDENDEDQTVNEYRVIIAVTDKNYNPVGTTKLNYYGHANGITIENGYLLVPGRVNHSYYKVATSTITSNAGSGTETTTGEVVNVNSLLQNISYDQRTLLLLEEKDEDRYFYIYDSNRNLIKKITHPADYYCPLDNFGGRQQVCMVNGIIYHLFIGNSPIRSVLSVIDTSTEELICHYYLDHNNYEVEGINFNDNIFRVSYSKIAATHIEVSPATLFYKMSSHGNNFLAIEDFVKQNNDKLTVYVDNSYIGIQRGSYQAPFSRLTTAIEMVNGIEKVNVRLITSNTSYQSEVDAYIKELYIRSESGNKNDVTLTGRINFFGKGLTVDWVTFDGIDKNLRGIVSNASESSVVLYDCTLKNLRECVSHLHQYGGIAINNSLIQNCNWGARGSDITMTISECTISGGNLCDSKGRIEYRNNTYSNGVQISNEGQLPHIICNSSTEVGKFFKHYIEGDATLNNDGIYVDVVHSAFGSGDTNFGNVRWAKCSFKFVPYSNHGIISHIFPIYRLNEINALDNSNTLYNAFKGLFGTSFASQFDTAGYSSLYGVTRIGENGSYQFIETLGGRTAYNKRGSTRPTMYLPEDVGNDFFDTTINKMIYWTGDTSEGKSGWVDATGTPV